MTVNERFPVVLTALRIRDILKNQTDADHPITKAAIAEQMHCDWRKIANCLDEMDIHNMIRYEKKRGKGIYYAPDESKDFTLAEIRMLIDSVLASRQIGPEETMALTKKLRAQLNEFDRRHVRYVSVSKGAGPSRPTCTYENIELLDKAMVQGCQVSFDYMTHSISKALVLEGSYQVSPYQLVFAGGFYMLLAMLDGQVRSFRLDRIANLQLLTKISAAPPHLGKNPERDGSIYVQNHPYMQVGEVGYIEVALQEEAIDRAIDAFGEGIRIFPEGDGIADDEVLVGIRANTEDVYLWALQNGDVATVLKPQSLRNRLRRISQNMNDRYLRFGTDHAAANLDAITGRVGHSMAKYFNKPYLLMSHTDTRRKLSQMGEQDKVREIILNVYNEEIARELPLYRNVRKITIPETCEDYGDDMPMDDLSCLAPLQRLEKLVVNRRDVTDGSALAGLSNLRWLDISLSGIRDIGFLSELPNLRWLDLLNVPVTDYLPLYALADLEFLRIDCSNVQNVDISRLKAKNPCLEAEVL